MRKRKNQSTQTWLQSAYRVLLAETLFTQSYAIPSGVLYFNSGNGFWKHLVVNAPPFLQVPSFNHHVFDFAKNNKLPLPYQISSAAILGIGSLALFISNLFSVSQGVRELFTWPQIKWMEKRDEKRLIIIAKYLAAIFKAIISSSSLFALGNSLPFIGFWPSLIFTLLCLPGTFVTQVAYFLEHGQSTKKSKRSKISCSILKKILSAYFTLGYALPSMALYFNTADEWAKRIGLTNIRLIFLNQRSLWLAIPYYIVHGSLSLLYGREIYRNYLRRNLKLFNLYKPDGEEQPLIIDTRKIPLQDKITTSGTIVTIYRMFGEFFSLTVLYAIIRDKALTPDTMSATDWTFVSFFAITSLISYVPQIPFYIKSPEDIARDRKNKNKKKGTMRRLYDFFLNKVGLKGEASESFSDLENPSEESSSSSFSDTLLGSKEIKLTEFSGTLPIASGSSTFDSEEEEEKPSTCGLQ